MGKLTSTKAQLVRDRLLAAMGSVGILLGIIGVLVLIAWGLAALWELGLLWPWIVLAVVIISTAVFAVYKQMERDEGDGDWCEINGDVDDED